MPTVSVYISDKQYSQLAYIMMTINRKKQYVDITIPKICAQIVSHALKHDCLNKIFGGEQNGKSN